MPSIARAFDLPFKIADIRVIRGDLYVYNATSQKIALLDAAGRIQTSWGKRGNAPGEFQLIFGWDADDKGVYAIDFNNRTITEMDRDGAVTTVYPLKEKFWRSHRLSPKKYLVKTADPQSIRSQTALLLDISNGKTRTVTLPLPKVENALALDGFFTKNDSGTSFYVCHRAGYFFALDAQGNPLYGGATVDHTPPPRILEEGSGRMKADPNSPIINLALSADANYLYVLSRATPRRGERKEFIDVYGTRDGRYEWSVSMPPYKGRPATAISVDRAGLYAVHGQNVVYYRFAHQR